MPLAAAGPTSPGTTQAVENTANTRGRRAAGYERATVAYATAGITPAPTPCATRPATSTAIDGAVPPTTSPTVNSAEAGGERQTGAPPVGGPARPGRCRAGCRGRTR